MKRRIAGFQSTFLIPAAVVAGISALCIYAYWNPADSAWFPRCPVLLLTGLRCPGCGSQRMLHALLHGDIAGAWGFNALLTLLLPLILALIIVEPFRFRYPRLYAVLHSRWVIVPVLTAMGLWTILRNIFGW